MSRNMSQIHKDKTDISDLNCTNTKIQLKIATVSRLMKSLLELRTV